MADLNWEKIETIIDEALALPEEEREEFIESNCEGDNALKSEVTLLLESIFDSEGWLENPSEYKDDFYRDISDSPENVSPGSTLIGEQIGPYRIKELLGEGGMGLVYLAERADGAFEHQVAVKVLREGMETSHNIRRFQQEQRVLAGLNHPNIAGILDGGEMENGLPYLIMEYVEGIPIDEYCKRQNCTFRERIELFKSICQAVQHAHNNLIVHRDLKPGNILVKEDGEIKILDFGIAKLLEADNEGTWLRTRTGARVLTLSYAAPEQVAGHSITTGVDNYALGTLLYRLLTGVHPFEKKGKSVSEMEEIILHTDPPKPAVRFRNLSDAKQEQLSKEMKSTPSDIVHMLRDDVGAIIFKNLRKEPEARYNSPNELLEDLNRFEKGLPVLAREGTVRYHMGKFVERHKVGIATTVIAILLLLGFGFFYTFKIAEERNQAQFEAQKSEQVIQFLTSLFDSNRPSQARGDTLTAVQLLRNGMNQIETMNQQPEVQASILRVIGDVYRVMGHYDEAEQLLSKAFERQHDLFEPDHTEIAKTAEAIAQLKFYTGDFQTSDSLFRMASATYEQIYEAPHETIARSIANHAELLEETGKLDKAEELYEQALNMFRELYGDEHNQIANVLNNLAIVYEKQGRLDASAEYYRRSLDMDLSLNTAADNRNPRVITSMHNLAMIYQKKGDNEKALELMEEALAARKKLYGNNHSFVASSMNGMALIQRDLGNYQQSEMLYRKALEILRSNYDDDHLHVNYNLINLGDILVYREKYQEADSLFRIVLTNFSELLGEKHIMYGVVNNQLGKVLFKQKKYEESLEHYSLALSILEKNVSADHPRLGDTMFGLGNNYLSMDEPAKAEQYLSKALDILKNSRGTRQQKTIDTYLVLGKSLIRLEKYGQAENVFLKGVEALVDKKGIENTETQDALKTLLDLYKRWDQPQKIKLLKDKYSIVAAS